MPCYGERTDRMSPSHLGLYYSKKHSLIETSIVIKWLIWYFQACPTQYTKKNLGMSDPGFICAKAYLGVRPSYLL